jgi:hypothetical protein
MALVLGHLGFELAGEWRSARQWRRAIVTADGQLRTVIIDLVEPGHGNLPPEYVKQTGFDSPAVASPRGRRPTPSSLTLKHA